MTEQTPEQIAAGLSEGERDRLLYGRLDWRDSNWQDHCGDLNCDHCTGYIPDPTPLRLPPKDQALRMAVQLVKRQS
jgi:hypothetical protein